MAANRVGKTFSAGGFELTCHLTGDYPTWWDGKRFRHPIRAWACGKTNETTRDIVQTTLLGEIEYRGSLKRVDGSGVVPRDKVGMDPGQLTWKQGVQDLVDTVKIKSGGWSKLGLKSYQQGRGAFEGTAQHVIWDDEEPPEDVYGEQIIRTATTGGIMMLTFTPLEGMSEVVQRFLPNVGID
jgi:phage terminase large subunit-like protein